MCPADNPPENLLKMNGLRISFDQYRRFIQKDSRKSPVEPESLHRPASIQLAFEFVPYDFIGLSQLRAGFAGFAKLLVGHGEDDMGRGRSRRNVFLIVQASLAPVGGFGVIAIDLGNVDEKLVRKIPLTTWFRFARVMEALPSALVILLPYSAAQSCAALTLNLAASAQWSGTDAVSHTRLISNVEFKVEVGRTRTKKAVQSASNNFTVRPQWA